MEEKVDLDIPSHLSMVEQYLLIHKHISDQHGKNSIVLMQVGSFYETYNHNNTGVDYVRVSNILQYEIFEKYNSFGVGIPEVSLEMCIDLLLDGGYTTIVQVDEVNKSKKKLRETRQIVKIITPGTYIKQNETIKNNYNTTYGIITHIHINILPQSKRSSFYPIIIAMITANVSSGDIEIMEIYNTIDDPNYAVDQLSRYLLNTRPSEVLMSLKLPQQQNKSIDAIIDDITHKANFKPTRILYREGIPPEIYKIGYQAQYLENIFGKIGALTSIQYLGLERNATSIVALIALIEYLHNCYPSLIKYLKKPRILDSSEYMVLASNAIDQLNILSSDNGNSLYSVLNTTITPMGSRLLKFRLSHPIISVKELNSRYEYIDYFKRNTQQDDLLMLMNKLPDIEKLHRHIQMGEISPAGVCRLIEAYYIIINILNLDIIKQCSNLIECNLINKVKSLKENIEVLDINIAKQCHKISDIDSNIFKSGYSRKCDDLNDILRKNEYIRNDICKKLTEHIGVKKKKGNRSNIEDTLLIDIKYEKEIFNLSCTKTTFTNLIKTIENEPLILAYNNILVEFSPETLVVISDTKNRKTFTGAGIKQISDQYYDTVELLTLAIKEEYILFLDNISKKYHEIMYEISNKISLLDLYVSNAKYANENRCCKPEVVDCEKSFIVGKEMRHPIIEHAISGPYIPHDIALGPQELYNLTSQPPDDTTPKAHMMLVYGSNTAGKSTFMREVAVCTIIAQAGLFAPAKSFSYSPIHSVYTRILTKDTDTTSSFQVEMMELSPMLTRGNFNSLILADELCHSTNHHESIAIVTSCLVELEKNGVLGIFTTHLHELMEMDEIKNSKIVPYHILTHFIKNPELINRDSGSDVSIITKPLMSIIYDRKLIPGVGPKNYAIDVASVTGIPQSVIEKSYSIVNRMNGKNGMLLSTKQSNYNSLVYMDHCKVKGKGCTGKAEETHHLLPQFLADDNGFIGDMPVNSPENIIPICKVCHDNITHNRLKK